MQKQILSLADFSGGITDFVDTAEPRQAEILENIFPDYDRRLRIREGLTQFASNLNTNEKITNIFELEGFVFLITTTNKLYYSKILDENTLDDFTELTGPSWTHLDASDDPGALNQHEQGVDVTRVGNPLEHPEIEYHWTVNIENGHAYITGDCQEEGDIVENANYPLTNSINDASKPRYTGDWKQPTSTWAKKVYIAQDGLPRLRTANLPTPGDINGQDNNIETMLDVGSFDWDDDFLNMSAKIVTIQAWYEYEYRAMVGGELKRFIDVSPPFTFQYRSDAKHGLYVRKLDNYSYFKSNFNNIYNSKIDDSSGYPALYTYQLQHWDLGVFTDNGGNQEIVYDDPSASGVRLRTAQDYPDIAAAEANTLYTQADANGLYSRYLDKVLTNETQPSVLPSGWSVLTVGTGVVYIEQFWNAYSQTDRTGGVETHYSPLDRILPSYEQSIVWNLPDFAAVNSAVGSTLANEAGWFAGALHQNNRVYQSIPYFYTLINRSAYTEYPDRVISLNKYKDRAIVGLKDSIYRIEGRIESGGTGFVEKVLVSNNYGVYSANSVVETQEGIYYFSDDGICYTSGIDSVKVSSHIDETYKAIKAYLAANDVDPYGTYDKENNRILWTCGIRKELKINDSWHSDTSTQTAEVPENQHEEKLAILILDLNNSQGVGSFYLYTFENEREFSPAVAFITELRKTLTVQDSNIQYLNEDSAVDEIGATKEYSRGIRPVMKTIAMDMNSKTYRKILKKMVFHLGKAKDRVTRIIPKLFTDRNINYGTSKAIDTEALETKLSTTRYMGDVLGKYKDEQTFYTTRRLPRRYSRAMTSQVELEIGMKELKTLSNVNAQINTKDSEGFCFAFGTTINGPLPALGVVAADTPAVDLDEAYYVSFSHDDHKTKFKLISYDHDSSQWNLKFECPWLLEYRWSGQFDMKIYSVPQDNYFEMINADIHYLMHSDEANRTASE